MPRERPYLGCLQLPVYYRSCLLIQNCGQFVSCPYAEYNQNMRLLIQRVKNATVTVNNSKVGQIEKGLLVFLGVSRADRDSDIEFIAEKMANLRIFEDEAGKMNLSLLDVKGELLVVSQFTLYADCKKGRRPSFTDAASPDLAGDLYKKFVQRCKEFGIKVETGEFGADMDIALTNWGPVTIMLDTKELTNNNAL